LANQLLDDRFFERLSAEAETLASGEVRAPSRLKSKIYSGLVRRQAQSGPLLSLSQTEAAGHPLCVFERLLGGSPVGEKAKSFNPCRVCHARLLAERIEAAPIFWRHCPYVDFQRR